MAGMKQLNFPVVGEYITIPPIALHSASVNALADVAARARAENAIEARRTFLVMALFSNGFMGLHLKMDLHLK
jgi:hypothetical protein